MFDFLRNLTKSAEEKRQEAITAYLDDAMSSSERERFAAQLAQDPTLQAEVERERAVKQSLSQLPQRRVPRNFTLDPTLYGRPAKQPLIQAYPVLRAATGLAAFFFIFALFAGFLTNRSALESGSVAFAPAAEPAMVEDTAVEQEAEPVDTEAVKVPAEEAMEEVAEEEMMAEEEATEEEAASDEEMLFAATAEPAAEEAMAEEPAMAPEEPLAEGDSMTGEEAPTGAEDAAPLPLPTQTMAIAATPTAVPTATISQIPRATATPELTDRTIAMTAEATNNINADEIAAAETAAPQDGVVEETAVPDQQEQEQPTPQPFNTLLIIQIGLLLLLIIFGAITLYARRQL